MALAAATAFDYLDRFPPDLKVSKVLLFYVLGISYVLGYGIQELFSTVGIVTTPNTEFFHSDRSTSGSRRRDKF